MPKNIFSACTINHHAILIFSAKCVSNLPIVSCSHNRPSTGQLGVMSFIALSQPPASLNVPHLQAQRLWVRPFCTTCLRILKSVGIHLQQLLQYLGSVTTYFVSVVLAQIPAYLIMQTRIFLVSEAESSWKLQCPLQCLVAGGVQTEK